MDKIPGQKRNERRYFVQIDFSELAPNEAMQFLTDDPLEVMLARETGVAAPSADMTTALDISAGARKSRATDDNLHPSLHLHEGNNKEIVVETDTTMTKKDRTEEDMTLEPIDADNTRNDPKAVKFAGAAMFQRPAHPHRPGSSLPQSLARIFLRNIAARQAVPQPDDHWELTEQLKKRLLRKFLLPNEWGIEGTMHKIWRLLSYGRVQSISFEQLLNDAVVPGHSRLIATECFMSILKLRQHGFVKVTVVPGTNEIKDIYLGPLMQKHI
ncbi:unnamed protein product [Leptidea sinapis]|uniref:Uncharacterized protein n=1 Tax=Leptidea sinapis TaxID=189913 RepID=A0A5E4Q0J0_9NEOP|nr:unnamed protein product [Leptidea sinapis]